MTIVENQMVEAKWSSKTRRYYESKGYSFTKNGNTFIVKLEDLTKGSRIKIKCKCDQCDKIFDREAMSVFKSERHFCSNKCKNNHLKLNPIIKENKVDCNCDMCNKTIRIEQYRYKNLLKGKQKNLFCSNECKNKWQSLNVNGENNPNFNSVEITCKHCGEKTLVPKSREETAKYCSDKCKRIDSRKTIKTECAICNKEINIVPSKLKESKSGKVFCSNKCVGIYNSIRFAKERIHKHCKICNKEYTVKASEAKSSVTCSVECQHIWQSNYLIGKNANNYKSNYTTEMRTHNCHWCDEEYILTSPYKVRQKEEGNPLFCSRDCYREWYAKEWSQSPEWKDESRIRAVKMLEDGLFDHTETECQLIVNDILSEINVKFENEYNCKYYSIDNYLIDFNLMIEVMGGYWHTDPRSYNEINYQMQMNRIKTDKAKKTYIKRTYGLNILYLWEKDVIENKELCKSLILEYIRNKGALKHYHSFNYRFKDGKLKTSSNIITPFMDYHIEDLRPLVNITGEKKSKKQEDKWIIFNCDVCGKEKEQLISRYNKNKSHCCSIKCASKYKNGKSKEQLKR